MAAEIIEAGTHLVIFRNSRRLQHMLGEKVVKIYPVAVGKNSTPTPTGSYQVVNKIVKPGGILGTRWMGLSIPNGPYGIHGTNNPGSIGKFISNGCIRMFNHDVEALFPGINIGTPVIITETSDDDHTGKSQLDDSDRIHVVKPGETLWGIARKYGIALDLLIAANHLSNPDALRIGQEIIIPR